MTGKQTADALRRIAEVIDRIVGEGPYPCAPFETAPLPPEAEAGAAFMVCYLRDLFTQANREQFTRSDILVMLETIGSDREIFAHNTGRLVWDLE